MKKSKHDIPLEITGIKEDGHHVFINATVNGNSVRLLVDTGASRTVFDESTVKKIQEGVELELNEDKAVGLGSVELDNFIANLRHISIAGMEIKDLQIGVLDLSHVNESYGKINMPPIDGVLGSDVLVKYKAVIDFGKKEMTLFG